MTFLLSPLRFPCPFPSRLVSWLFLSFHGCFFFFSSMCLPFTNPLNVLLCLFWLSVYVHVHAWPREARSGFYIPWDGIKMVVRYNMNPRTQFQFSTKATSILNHWPISPDPSCLSLIFICSLTNYCVGLKKNHSMKTISAPNACLEKGGLPTIKWRKHRQLTMDAISFKHKIHTTMRNHVSVFLPA